MLKPLQLTVGPEQRLLAQMSMPLELDDLLSGAGACEVELGFGKGRYLLRRAREEPERRFIGIEIVSKYCRILGGRARRLGVENLAVIRGEVAYALSTVMPRGFAEAVHVYFPDPWPKTRHRRRRLFDPERIDLVLGLLKPGGTLFFATDFLAYGEKVKSLLVSHPALRVETLEGPWPEGPRTNYEAKYVAEGRPILRLAVSVDPGAQDSLIHPRGATGILVAVVQRHPG